MKKLLIGIFASALLLTACSNEKPSEDINKEETQEQVAVEEGAKEEATEGTKETAEATEDKPVKELNLDLEKLYPQEDFRKYAESFIGTKAPDFTLTNLNGDSVSLSDYRGQNVIIELAQTTCPICTATQPIIDNYKQSQDDVVVLQLFATEKKDAVERFLKETNSTTNDYVLTGDKANKVFQNYKVQFVPTFLFVDKNGFVAFVHIGAMEADMLDMFTQLAFE